MRLTRISFTDIGKLIQRYSRYQQSCLSIEQFTTFGKQFSKGRFTRYEFCRMRRATSLRQAYDTTYDCRSVLKHVLKCYEIFLMYTPIVSHVVGMS